MIKDFIEYLKLKKIEKIKTAEFELTNVSPFNAVMFKKLVETVKQDLYVVVTLVDGNKIEMWSKKPDDHDPTKKQFNEYW